MFLTKKTITLAVALALQLMQQAALAQTDPSPAASPTQTQAMGQVVITSSKIKMVEPDNVSLDAAKLAAKRASSSDTAALLKDVPGVSLYGAGGVSSLPAIHGMADDRVRIKVDGMDLISACANHMNSPLSYIDPTNVAGIKVFAGITPVSAGGDSIAGTIQVKSAAPEFAKSGEGILLKGQFGSFYRSNGNAKGANLSATMANENFSIAYTGSTTEAGNYSAAGDFKPAAQSAGTSSFLAGDEVGSSSYKAENQAIAVALRRENHLLELKLGLQRIPYQGFPNQRMDMTGNESDQVNLRYVGAYQWGSLETRVYNEDTRHKMNFLEDKLTIGAKGMPMDTEGKTTGALLKADIVLSERDTFRIGSEYQRYRLDDWWDPISTTPGMMAPNPFWNIRNGQRDRFDLFGEWEAHWSPRWQSQLGMRSSTMTMNSGEVQGYNNMGGRMGYGDPANPASVPGAFNAADRKKTDHNIDLTALGRYTPDAEKTFEIGYARKVRSPNLYERFAWSTNNTMVMNMINWFGDANGYVGNLDLKPEVANTLSATASWHDAAQEKWALNVTPYYTHVEDYVDAASCATVGKTCPTRTDGFVNLSFANQSARLYGVDVSGYMPLANSGDYGTFTATGLLSYVNGKNMTTGDNLYNIMPLNAKFAVVHRIGNWTNTVEGQFVDAKTKLSQVRNELKSGGYSLLNLHTSYEWKQVRLDIGVDNALNKLYASPLGGVYVGQKPMTYGTPVPGMGRSLYTALNVKF